MDLDLARIHSNIQLFIHAQIRKHCQEANKSELYDLFIEKNTEHIRDIVCEIFNNLCDDDNLEFFNMTFDETDIQNIQKYKVQYALTLDCWDYMGLSLD